MADKLSIVIPHVSFGEEAETMLNNCLASLNSYDELVIVVNDGIGYGKSFNRGFRYAQGDYIVAVSNDTVLTSGNLRDMCVPDVVTFASNAQFGCFFCLPRSIYQLTKGFNEDYGLAYWEDEDFLLRLEDLKVPLRRIGSIKVNHIGGATVKALGKEQESMDFGRKLHEERWGDRRAYIPELS